MATDQGPVGAASVSGHRGVGAVDAGAWLSPLMPFGENDAAKGVPDGCSSNARLHIRTHERASRINRSGSPFLQLGSPNSTNESHLPPEKRLGTNTRPERRCCFRAGTRLATGEVEAPVTGEYRWRSSRHVHEPSLAGMRQRLHSATVGLAPTAARSAPTTRTDGTRYRPFSP